MTKKQYTILVLLIFVLVILGLGILILGAVLQDRDSTISIGPMLIGVFGSFIAAFVLVVSNLSKLTRYEIERRIRKNESLEIRKRRNVRNDLAVRIGMMAMIWIVYFIRPYPFYLVLSIGMSGFFILDIIRSIRKKDLSSEPYPLTPLDAVRRIFFRLSLLLFLVFVATVVSFGGIAISDDLASSSYEGYRTGTYYLANQNALTEVSYEKWMFMRVFEFISIPLVIVSALGSILYVGFTKGWKSMIHPY